MKKRSTRTNNSKRAAPGAGVRNLDISIRRTNKDLNGTRKKLNDFLYAGGLNAETALHIEMAVYEAAANVIEHGGAPFKRDAILINCSLARRTATVSITYRGLEFDPTGATLPDIKTHFDSGKDGGLGIYIIMALMDSVSYSFSENTNTLTLKKNIGRGLRKS